MKKFNIKYATLLSVAALITIIASTPSFATKRMGEELVQTTKKKPKVDINTEQETFVNDDELIKEINTFLKQDNDFPLYEGEKADMLVKMFLKGNFDFFDINQKNKIMSLIANIEEKSLKNIDYSIYRIVFTKIPITDSLLSFINKSVTQLDPNAQYLLGTMYRMSLGVDQNHQEAVKYLTLSADQGNARAQHDLGAMYQMGHGVDQNDQEAVKYFKRSADQGFCHGQNKLGYMYQMGRGVDQSDPENDQEAVKYLTLSADQGNFHAQYSLGYMYQKGRGVDQNDQEAFKYYKLSADQGLSYAQCHLGTMYQKGRGVDQNDQEAVKYLTLSADQGLASAQCYLAHMYQRGLGVDQNDQEAFKYYKLSADQGLSYAQCHLGTMYQRGLGVDQNDPENDQQAVKYFKLSADQGLSHAKNSLKELITIYPQLKEGNLEKVSFSLSQKSKEKFGNILPELDIYQALTNPGHHYEDSNHNPVIYNHLKNLSNDIKKIDLEKLETMFTQTGFMVKNIMPSFNISKGAASAASLWPFTFEDQIYHCCGEEAVQTAYKILPLIDKIMNHPDITFSISGFEVTSSFLEEEDKESIENCTAMIQRLKEIQETLNEIGEAVGKEIKHGVEQRNKDLEDYLN